MAILVGRRWQNTLIEPVVEGLRSNRFAALRAAATEGPTFNAKPGLD